MEPGWDKLYALERLMLDDFSSFGSSSPTITSHLTIRGAVSASWVDQHLAKRLAMHPRFRSVIDPTGNRFVLVEDFCTVVHKYITQHNDKLSHAAFEAILSKPLNPYRALWHIHVFKHEQDFTDIVVQMHHIISDGIGLGTFCMSTVLDKQFPTLPRTEQASLPERRPVHKELVAAGAIPTTLEVLTRNVRDIFAAMLYPIIPDSPSVLNTGEFSPDKLAAFARPRSVLELRSAGRRVGLTLNDIVSTAVAGAVHSYTLSIEGKVPSRVTAVIPVSGFSTSLHNSASALHLKLPVNEESRIARLATCKHKMSDMLAGCRTFILLFLMVLVAWLPKPVRVRLSKFATRSGTLGLTNVPGPPTRRTLAGREIMKVRSIAPGQGNTSVVVTVTSYGNELTVGVWADAHRLPKPQKFLEAFDHEMDEILKWIDSVTA